MKSYLNIELQHEDVNILKWIHGLGFHGVRHGLRNNNQWDLIRAIFNALKAVPELSPLFLLPLENDTSDKNAVLDFTETIAALIADYGFDREDVALEFANEPDLFNTQWKNNPEALGRLFCDAIPVIRKQAKNIKILTPSVHNLNMAGQEYARTMFYPIKRLANDYHIAFHRYPSRKGHESHLGYGTRLKEFQAFITAVGDGTPREYWCTETGYSQWTKRSKNFPLCFLKEKHKRSESEQAEFCVLEYGFWADMGVQSLVWYQLNDGPGDDALDGFGIRRFDGEPKKIAAYLESTHETLKVFETLESQ